MNKSLYPICLILIPIFAPRISWSQELVTINLFHSSDGIDPLQYEYSDEREAVKKTNSGFTLYLDEGGTVCLNVINAHPVLYTYISKAEAAEPDQSIPNQNLLIPLLSGLLGVQTPELQDNEGNKKDGGGTSSGKVDALQAYFSEIENLKNNIDKAKDLINTSDTPDDKVNDNGKGISNFENAKSEILLLLKDNPKDKLIALKQKALVYVSEENFNAINKKIGDLDGILEELVNKLRGDTSVQPPQLGLDKRIDDSESSIKNISQSTSFQDIKSSVNSYTTIVNERRNVLSEISKSKSDLIQQQVEYGKITFGSVPGRKIIEAFDTYVEALLAVRKAIYDGFLNAKYTKQCEKVSNTTTTVTLNAQATEYDSARKRKSWKKGEKSLFTVKIEPRLSRPHLELVPASFFVLTRAVSEFEVKDGKVAKIADENIKPIVRPGAMFVGKVFSFDKQNKVVLSAGLGFGLTGDEGTPLLDFMSGFFLDFNGGQFRIGGGVGWAKLPSALGSNLSVGDPLPENISNIDAVIIKETKTVGYIVFTLKGLPINLPFL